ncbi:efflux RND transporter periplasmic adaptor subunit [Gracilimonas sp.]|uniref:efflux RND transporter periplasmic adaptor subunit n=1 Tax=Gracilimonas sp. TaxID=1974203 RepID=UPI00287278BD|nr:efflux RND transporter periplasmic adaptor subunit [Gracilimonas sp.]
MKKLNLVLITLLTMAFAMACSEDESSQNGEDEPVGKSVNVETTVLEPSEFRSQLRIVGNVETKNDIMISAEVGGRVLSHHISEGDEVQKGELIMSLDTAKLQQEKARLEAATSQARENYERLRTIYEEDSIGSEIDFLNAKFNYQQSEAALASINVDIDNARITAPFTGIVENYLVEKGEIASPGVPVVRLIGSDTFIISAGVPARYADVVNSGDEVEVWFDSQMADTLQGPITYVGKSIDPQSRTFRVEVLLPTDKQSYKVDMIANLRLNTLYEDNVIIVSEEFIYKEDDEFVTFVKAVDEEGNPIAERRVVELGPSFKSDVIIRDGLEFGDELVTIGSAFLNEGARLNIIESEGGNLASQ